MSGNGVTLSDEESKQVLADMYTNLFEKYVPRSIDYILKGIIDGEMGVKLQQVIPITNIDMIKQLCSVIDAFIPLDLADQSVRFTRIKQNYTRLYTYISVHFKI
jgi:dynein heavy chain